MTVDKELAALDEVVGMIDPKRELYFHELNKQWTASDWDDWPVGKIIALAIREKQARKWIEKWCKKREQEVEAFYRPNAEDGHTHIVRISRRAMPQAWLIRVQASGTSWAETLAAAVRKLDAMDREGAQKGITCNE